MLIKNGVWGASDVKIIEGITISDGVVAAAGAVAIKDVPPYAIVGGLPARIIRYRFEQADIKDLHKVIEKSYGDGT